MLKLSLFISVINYLGVYSQQRSVDRILLAAAGQYHDSPQLPIFINDEFFDEFPSTMTANELYRIVAIRKELHHSKLFDLKYQSKIIEPNNEELMNIDGFNGGEDGNKLQLQFKSINIPTKLLILGISPLNTIIPPSTDIR